MEKNPLGTFFALVSQRKRKFELNKLLRAPKRLDLRVSVFGCCRQDALSAIANTSGIRDGLTYPHNTKEIIQAIKYCQGLIDVPDFAFRNFQLGAKMASRTKLRRWFRNSNFFVVEISSRNVFEYKDVVMHHVALEDRRHIPAQVHQKVPLPIMRVQSDFEINSDVDEIVRLLGGPEKVLLVTHFSTFEGSRSQLAKLIQDRAEDLGVDCFNPSSLLSQWSSKDLFVDEDVLAHYTTKGHQIAGNRYRRHLQSAKVHNRNRRRSLIQVVDDSPRKVKEFGFHGFGDVALGSAFLFQLARSWGRPLGVDWTKSNLESLVTSRTWHVDDDLKQIPVKFLFHGARLSEFKNASRVFTNIRPALPLDVEVKDFLREQFFTFDSTVTGYSEAMLHALDIDPCNFVGIHVRLGDIVSFNGHGSDLDHSALVARLQTLERDASAPVLIFSDSKDFKDECARAGLKVSSSNPSHVGKALGLGSAELPMLGVLGDLYLLSKASQIIQFSTYGWGSSFSRLAAEAFEIELLSFGIKIVESKVQIVAEED